MKKVMKLFFVAGIFSICLFSTKAAMAYPFGDGGAALQGVLDQITDLGDDGTDNDSIASSVDVTTDMLGFDSTWSLTATGGSVSTLIIELAGFKDKNVFGVYQNGTYVSLLGGAASAGDTVTFGLNLDGSVLVNSVDTGIDFTGGNNFGYYLDSSANAGGGLFHSDTALNTDGIDHMLAYQGTGDMVQLPNKFPGEWTDNEYILAFEDLNGGGDNDHTDFVIMVESVQPVPEPGTIALLGIGLAGLVGVGVRRRVNKKAVDKT